MLLLECVARVCMGATDWERLAQHFVPLTVHIICSYVFLLTGCPCSHYSDEVCVEWPRSVHIHELSTLPPAIMILCVQMS